MNAIGVFFVFLRLGLTSFGGPIAHLAYFHDEFVKRRRWLDEHAFADLVALCQFLPGPASSQVGIAIGLSRAGTLGALAAWLGFTLPSAVALIGFALGASKISDYFGTGWVHGLKIAAVAIVAQALWLMGTRLSRGMFQAMITLASALLITQLPFAFGQVVIIVSAGVIGWLLIKADDPPPHVPITIEIRRSQAGLILAFFFLALLVLPLLASASGNLYVKLFDSFFRAGSLVFGGGHVVLPMLKSEVVNSGWVSADAFMAGYGAAQAIPGPLFTFASYLGAVIAGWRGAIVCLVAAFLPAFLLVFGALPFWESLRKNQSMRSAMAGINAAVVGLLLAAFVNPVWSGAIYTSKDLGLALAAFILLVYFNTPAWIVVSVCAVGAGVFF